MTANYAQLKTYRYRLEPGDATRYEFMLTFHKVLDGNIDSIQDVIAGVGIKDDYVTLTICMPHVGGSYEFDKVRLFNLGQEIDRYFVSYAAEKFSGKGNGWIAGAGYAGLLGAGRRAGCC